MSSTFGNVVGADTTCSTMAPHADFDGSGKIDTGDFSIIQVNFARDGGPVSDPNCCGLFPQCNSALFGADPVFSISVQELRQIGLAGAAAGDLNSDGWVDLEDMNLFTQGVRPQPRPQPRPRPTNGGIRPTSVSPRPVGGSGNTGVSPQEQGLEPSGG